MMGGLSSKAAGGDESTEVGSTVSGAFLSATFLVMNQAAAGRTESGHGRQRQDKPAMPKAAAVSVTRWLLMMQRDCGRTPMARNKVIGSCAVECPGLDESPTGRSGFGDQRLGIMLSSRRSHCPWCGCALGRSASGPALAKSARHLIMLHHVQIM